VNTVDSLTGHQADGKTWDTALFGALLQTDERCQCKPHALPCGVLDGMLQATIPNGLHAEARIG
jgi:hypothetical protein